MGKAFLAIAALAIAGTLGPAAAAPPLAPAVTRTPGTAAPKPGAPAPTAPPAACGVTGAPACTPKAAAPAVVGAYSGGNPQDYAAALRAVPPKPGARDTALDDGLVTAMSRLMAAGRCGDATALASRSGRDQLAARARQLCPGS